MCTKPGAPKKFLVRCGAAPVQCLLYTLRCGAAPVQCLFVCWAVRCAPVQLLSVRCCIGAPWFYILAVWCTPVQLECIWCAGAYTGARRKNHQTSNLIKKLLYIKITKPFIHNKPIIIEIPKLFLYYNKCTTILILFYDNLLLLPNLFILCYY